jgi:two-component system, chemotaxis family, sensor kinase Cph1
MISLDLVSQVKKRIANLTDPDLVVTDVSLTNCDREPIHIPSAIQSHGVLLTFSEVSLVILQISRNSEVFLGKKPDALLGRLLSILMQPEQIEAIQDCLNAEFESVNPLRLILSVAGKEQMFEGVVHRTDGVVILELERSIEQQSVNFFDFYKFVKSPINHLQRTASLVELVKQAVIAIRNITGFDRVMLYRFNKDGSGNVIAENKCEEVESFLGLHYPATDIPQQAKELYRLNLLRIIPNTLYERVLLEPALNPLAGKALDMSFSTLRSVSPLHTEYLSNMGVSASMSISILRDRQLWGLIACHHNSPKKLSYETRTICEFLGQVISSEIISKVDAEELAYKINLQVVHSRFVNTIATCQTLLEGLQQKPHDLMGLVDATGVVFCENHKFTSFGKTPPERVMPELLEWVDQQMAENAVFSTNTLITDYPQFAAYQDIASGLLALRISRVQQTYLIWFRPEVIQTINWGGDPKKLVVTDADNNLRITPRKSFELWKETVRLKSLPWKSCEIEAALELRSRIVGILLQKADELALLNTELERSNMELDSFAYVASHDLREPLRGIHNYSTFLMEDYGEKLGEEGSHKLATLMRLTQRMEDLINSLLHYSRFGRAELVVEAVDLQKVVKEVLNVIEINQPTPIEVRIPRTLPVVQCDQPQVTELFANLISNAVKYNDREQKWVEIGYILPEEINQDLPKSIDRSKTVFFVRDNGIGILAKHLETIFKIFKRLHPPSKYVGGTGAGLTITKKIIERHNGSIAVESVFGEGSTFYFTLGQPG